MDEPFPWVKTHGYDYQSLRDEGPLSRSDNLIPNSLFQIPPPSCLNSKFQIQHSAAAGG